MDKLYLVFSKERLFIVDTWNDCKEITHGIKGRAFKSFKPDEKKEMVEWFLSHIIKQEEKIKANLMDELEILFNRKTIEECMANLNKGVPTDKEELNQYIEEVMKENFIAFVDGSYCKDTSEYSYGICVVKNNKVYYENAEKFADMNGMRQINGELKGAIMACRYALKNNINKLYIGYDYQGIEFFATKQWTPNKECIQFYVDAMQKYMKVLDIHFIKIPAHQKVFIYNEYADCLSKDILGISNNLNVYK